jgi:lipopolysaccharide/colanic/teichoic acid biosynthesis glycosyltransferase
MSINIKLIFFHNMKNKMKYLFDRIFSLISLVGLSPFLLFIYLKIFFTMPGGPVLFKQKRIGRYGKPFNIIKFRTMIINHHGKSISILGEPRITRFGVFLRRHKFDELPELWNILIGEMSFVGPRPDVAGYMDLLEGEERKILELRPGLTGPASIKYANEEKLLASVENPNEYNDRVIFPDKVKINLHYYYHRTFYGDLKMIFSTFFRILKA